MLDNKVYIVGAGPGDPELITVKGLRILQEADVVIYTDSLVSEELIAQAGKHAMIVKSAGMDLVQIVDLMVTHVQAGQSVARVHTGDPAVYGAILEQMALLQQLGIGYEMIPGVSSVFAAAAALGAELTVPDLTQTVILTRVGGERLCRLVKICDHLQNIIARWHFISLQPLQKPLLMNFFWPDGIKKLLLQWCKKPHGQNKRSFARR